jgi:hypothetical protein
MLFSIRRLPSSGLPSLQAISSSQCIRLIYWYINPTLPNPQELADDKQKSSGKYIWLQPAPASTPILSIGDQTKNVGPIVLAIAKKPELTLGGKFVLATVDKFSAGEYLATWGRHTGKNTDYAEISLAEYDRLWPMWGLEMGVMMEFWGEYGDKSWTGEELLTKEDLGVDEKLVTVAEAFATFDWSSVL